MPCRDLLASPFAEPGAVRSVDARDVAASDLMGRQGHRHLLQAYDWTVENDATDATEVVMEELFYVAIGSVVGAVVAPRIRPMLVGALAAGYKLADFASAQTAEQRKNLEAHLEAWRNEWEGFISEARARARDETHVEANAKA